MHMIDFALGIQKLKNPKEVHFLVRQGAIHWLAVDFCGRQYVIPFAEKFGVIQNETLKIFLAMTKKINWAPYLVILLVGRVDKTKSDNWILWYADLG